MTWSILIWILNVSHYFFKAVFQWHHFCDEYLINTNVEQHNEEGESKHLLLAGSFGETQRQRVLYSFYSCPNTKKYKSALPKLNSNWSKPKHVSCLLFACTVPILCLWGALPPLVWVHRCVCVRENWSSFDLMYFKC